MYNTVSVVQAIMQAINNFFLDLNGMSTEHVILTSRGVSVCAFQNVVPSNKELKFTSPRTDLPPLGGLNKLGPALRGIRDGAGKIVHAI